MPEDTQRPPWIDHYPDHWPRDMSYPEISTAELLTRRAETFPEHLAIVFQGREYTYATLQERVNAFAAGLASIGVTRGDVVSVCMPNCPQFTIAFYGTHMLGAVVAHTSYLYSPRELKAQLNASEADVVIVLDEYVDLVAEVVEETSVESVVVTSLADVCSPDISRFLSRSNEQLVEANGWRWFPELLEESTSPPSVDVDVDDLASLLFTGGTTGLPKAVPVTHRYWLCTNAQGELIDLVAYQEDGSIERGQQVMTGLMPMFHLNGNWTANQYAVYNGSAVVLYPSFDPGIVLRDIEQYGVTHMHTVPTMLTALMDHPRIETTDFSSLRHLAVASAPVPTAKKQEIERLTGATIFELYGQTETAFVTAEPPSMTREGSCGIPVPGVSLDVIDIDGTDPVKAGEIGEFAVEVADHTMDGYWNNPEETDRTVVDGWIHTSDIGYRDDEWHFYHVDRKDDLIITGGHNVYPAEVEDVIHELDSVNEVAVIGIPDDYRGELVGAYIELDSHPSENGLTVDEIRNWCERNLSSYKVPDVIEIRDLPRTDVGKISRKRIEEQVIEDQE